MNLQEVLDELQTYGNETTKRTYMHHGAVEPFWGVKVSDMKIILKKIKNNQELAMQLYDSGISDAMYLAGLVANGAKMSKEKIKSWAENAKWYMHSEYTVPWVASEHPDALELALAWIDSEMESLATSGWCTLAALVVMKQDSELDMDLFKHLLSRVEKEIHQAPNRVRYAMNSFVIALGSGISSLTHEAIAVGVNNGKLMVDMGNTACKVPYAPDYIKKVMDAGKVGAKRKTVKC